MNAKRNANKRLPNPFLTRNPSNGTENSNNNYNNNNTQMKHVINNNMVKRNLNAKKCVVGHTLGKKNWLQNSSAFFLKCDGKNMMKFSVGADKNSLILGILN